MPRKLKLLMLLPFAAVLALAIVAAGPVRRIRLCLVGSARIGHFVTSVEVYLCKADAGIPTTPPSCADLFYFEEYTSVMLLPGKRRKLTLPQTLALAPRRTPVSRAFARHTRVEYARSTVDTSSRTA